MTTLETVFRSPEICVLLDDAMDLWVALVDRETNQVTVSGETWNELSDDRAAMKAFRTGVRSGHSGLRMLREPQASDDRLQRLTGDLGALVAKTASLSSDMDEARLQQVTFEHSRARTRLLALEDELAAARLMLEVATDALCDL